jgi:exosortase family protein XrtF
MKTLPLKEFKPTILFLVKFIGIYIVANLLYGVYVTAYSPGPDPITSLASRQTAVALGICGWHSSTEDNETKPTTLLIHEGKSVLAIYEGCNGINIMIIFVAFLFAFGPIGKSLWIFALAGIIIIHLMNLARIALLFWVTLYLPDLVYFVHKYLFTAVLFVIVFVLWIVWVRRFSKLKEVSTQ